MLFHASFVRQVDFDYQSGQVLQSLQSLVKSFVRLFYWREEGMFPGYSMLTLQVIVHFNAKAYCYGVLKKWRTKSSF